MRVDRVVTGARKSNRPYMTLAKLGEYLGFQGSTAKGRRESARKWVERNGIPKKFRGKAWLVDPDVVDAVLNGEQLKSA